MQYRMIDLKNRKDGRTEIIDVFDSKSIVW